MGVDRVQAAATCAPAVCEEYVKRCMSAVASTEMSDQARCDNTLSECAVGYLQCMETMLGNGTSGGGINQSCVDSGIPSAMHNELLAVESGVLYNGTRLEESCSVFMCSTFATIYGHLYLPWCQQHTSGASTICVGPASTTWPFVYAPPADTMAPEVTESPTNEPPPVTSEPSTAEPTPEPTPVPPVETPVPPTQDPCATAGAFTCHDAYPTRQLCAIRNTSAEGECDSCTDNEITPAVLFYGFAAPPMDGSIQAVDADASKELLIEAAAFYTTCAAADVSGFFTDVRFAWAGIVNSTGMDAGLGQVTTLTARTLSIPAKFLVVGVAYRLTLTVSAYNGVSSAAVSSSSRSIVVMGTAPVPTVRMVGGDRTISYVTPLQLSLVINDAYYAAQGVRWTCCIATNGVCALSPCPFPFDDIVMRIASITFTPAVGKPLPGGTFVFTAVYKAIESTRVSALITIRETTEIVPEVLVFQPAGYLRADTAITVSGTVKNVNPSLIASYTWRVNGTIKQGETQPFITFDKNYFSGGVGVRVTLEVTTTAGVKNSGSTEFTTSSVVFPGTCTVSASSIGSSAIASVSELTVTSHNARFDSATRKRLVYRVGYFDMPRPIGPVTAADDSKKRYTSPVFVSQPTSYVIAPVLSVFLEQGEQRATATFFIDVAVEDDTATVVTSACQVDIVTFLAAKSLKSLVNEELNDLKAAVASGDRIRAVGAAEQALSVVEFGASQMGNVAGAPSVASVAEGVVSNMSAIAVAQKSSLSVADRDVVAGVATRAVNLWRSGTGSASSPASGGVPRKPPAATTSAVLNIISSVTATPTVSSDALSVPLSGPKVLDLLDFLLPFNTATNATSEASAADLSATDKQTIQSAVESLAKTASRAASLGSQTAVHSKGFAVASSRKFGFDVVGADISTMGHLAGAGGGSGSGGGAAFKVGVDISHRLSTMSTVALSIAATPPHGRIVQVLNATAQRCTRLDVCPILRRRGRGRGSCSRCRRSWRRLRGG